MKILQIFAAIMLMSVASVVYAETTNRTVELEATSNALRDDARARLIVGIVDQSDTGSGKGRWVTFALNFTRLSCLGPFSTEDGVLFYALYVNDQRLLSFNTKCRYAGAPGDIGGEFNTSLIFTDTNQDELIGWLDDPLNDDIRAIVRLESHEFDPGQGPIVLAGLLSGDVACPCWTSADIAALPIEGTTASCLTDGGRMDIAQNGICEHSYGVALDGSCVTNRFDCPGLPDSGDGFIINDSEFSACRNQILHRCEELGIDPPPPPPIFCQWIPDQTDGENCNDWVPGEFFPTRNGPDGNEPGWEQCIYIELCD